ncbi:unnamed protein product [Phyllotreta striolata]|uniref:Uncharacterized protein n=1 Tax=Phyllotreta striolata TaxID=444603 RepID=A0A9N9XTV4_PHYSR|nr:unnamed protein product [Phyllotreta striolata]
MEQKSSYDKLKEDKPPKSPKSPSSPVRPFRLRFRRMLSAGSLKSGSSSTPGTPSPGSKTPDGKFYSFDEDCVEAFYNGKSSRSKYGVKKAGKKKKVKVHKDNKKKGRGGKKRINGDVGDGHLNELIPLIKITDVDWLTSLNTLHQAISGGTRSVSGSLLLVDCSRAILDSDFESFCPLLPLFNAGDVIFPAK